MALRTQSRHEREDTADHLVLKGLAKHYGSVKAVEDVSLTVRSGELVSLLGPSGCGKTTTLRMVAGFVEPTAGSIHVRGRELSNVPPYRRRMGMVFQSYALFPHLDVFGNVVFGLQMSRVPKKEAAQRVSAALEHVHLGGYEKRRIRELSGGQQQRVALARALVTEPTVLLLDEPLSNLDANLRENMRDEIRSIQREIGITTLFVTHDQVEALTISDRVVVLNGGKIEQVGTPEEVYEQPASRFVADFIGRANFFAATVESSTGDQSRVLSSVGKTFDVPRSLNPGNRVALMIRPHRMRVDTSEELGAVRGRVTNVVYLGDLIQYDVSVGDTHFLVESPSANTQVARLAVGDETFLHMNQNDVLVYNDENHGIRTENR